jgi:hypothetical protein
VVLSYDDALRVCPDLLNALPVLYARLFLRVVASPQNVVGATLEARVPLVANPTDPLDSLVSEQGLGAALLLEIYKFVFKLNPCRQMSG